MATKPSVTVGWRCMGGDWDEGCTAEDGPCAPHCGPVLVVEGEPCPNGCPWCACGACDGIEDAGIYGHPADEPRLPAYCPSCIDGVVPVGGSIVDHWGYPPVRAMIVPLKEDQ